MKRLLVIGFVLVAALVLCVGTMALIGWRLPRSHSATRSVLLHRSPSEVYAVIRDVGAGPSWRDDVKQVAVQPQPDGRLHFRETGSNGAVNYELVEDVPGQRMVTRILDQDLGYSGKWTYLLTAENGGTRLTITEDGEVSNVLFRFMSRYVFGHTATLDAYLNALAKRFGESAAVRD
jgi:hypothetical protein